MNNLYWVKEGNKHLLKNEENVLIELGINMVDPSFFTISNKHYSIGRKGFWNAYYIQEGNMEIAKIVHSFWGSNSRIVFADGSSFTGEYKVKQGNLQLRYLDGDKEILSYKALLEHGKPSFHFSVGTSMVDAEKLLLLAALGKVIFTLLYSDGQSNDDLNAILLFASA